MLFRTPGQRHPRLELLKHVVLFKDLSWHELAVIDNQLHQRHYLAGEVIFDEGEEGQGLFITLFRAEFYSLLQTHSAIASRVSFQLARMLATRLRQNILATDEHHEAS
jgi:CRP-like cAMP-binding protein